MDATGAWSLTPAYDVTFAKGGGWTASHQMRIADKRAGIHRRDLLHVADAFGIRNPQKIIARVEDAVARWPEYAARTGVPRATVDTVQRALTERAREMG